jgi:hypothetical protein
VGGISLSYYDFLNNYNTKTELHEILNRQLIKPSLPASKMQKKPCLYKVLYGGEV